MNFRTQMEFRFPFLAGIMICAESLILALMSAQLGYPEWAENFFYLGTYTVVLLEFWYFLADWIRWRF